MGTLRLEELGFDSAWLPDHFVNPRGPIDVWFDARTLLDALAAETHHIRIGTLVTTITLRHPAILAKQALTASTSRVDSWSWGLAPAALRSIIP